MIIIIQIIGIVFGLIMAYFTFLNYKKKNLNYTQFLLWEILWFGLIALVAFPQILNVVRGKLAITRRMDLLMIGGFIIFISLSFYNYLITKKLENKLEELVRKEALKKLKK